MKLLKISLLAVCLSFSSYSFADAASEKEATKLLDTMGMQQSVEQSMAQMLDIQIRQNPRMAQFRPVFKEFLNKHMGWASLKPEMVKIYSEAFTADELRDINAFYDSSTGQKTVKLMPKLMAQGAQIGLAKVEKNKAELESMIKAYAEKLKAEQESKAKAE